MTEYTKPSKETFDTAKKMLNLCNNMELTEVADVLSIVLGSIAMNISKEVALEMLVNIGNNISFGTYSAFGKKGNSN